MLDSIQRVHFIGIGGYGMSALAFVLLESGYEVSGSDLNTSRLTENLQKTGAAVYVGHRADQVGDAQLVVYSTAIPAHNPELQEARARGLSVWHRSELLASLMNDKHGVAITGTHGKTTSTAMVSLLLEQGGLDPTAIIGGEVSFLGGNARVGRGKYVVAEACEGDRSFLRYRPSFAMVTNVEADHLEFYEGDFRRMIDAYRGFLGNVKGEGSAVLCVDDPVLNEMKSTLQGRVLTYGFSAGADIRGDGLQLEGLGSRFRAFSRDRLLGEVQLKVPGVHNALNALGATAVGLELGIDFAQIRDALFQFRGVKRRFEIVGEGRDIMVVDDYGHHPTEIRATLKAACGSVRRVLCVFQPHRYSRTRDLWGDFIGAFGEADVLVLTPIYSAGEEPLPGVTGEKLAETVQQNAAGMVYYRHDFEEVQSLLENMARPGDLVLTMGAGDVWKVGAAFANNNAP